MIYIGHLSPEDLDEAGAVIEAAFGRTGMARRMRLYYGLQPQHWFCLARDGQIVAAVGAYGYETAASVGMMGVSPGAQRQGLGLMLMTHLVAHLDAHGYQQIFLEASAAGIHLYPRLGFEAAGETLRMVWPEHLAQPDTPAPGPEILARPMTADDLPAVITFDASTFGTARPEVLAALYATSPRRGFVVRDPSGNLSGYLMADAGTIGPWAAQSPSAAGDLLAAALTLTYESGPRATFPAENAAAQSLLASRGFVPTERLVHMYRGDPKDPRDPRRYYGQSSLMLG